MIIKYQNFVDKNLLIVKYEGDFCIDLYKKHVYDMIQKPEWGATDKVLVDLRFINVELFKLEDISEFVNIKKNVIKKQHKSVQLVDKPMITALTHLLQNEFKLDSNIDIEYCSTVKMALKLLDINESENDFNKILNNLEHTY